MTIRTLREPEVSYASFGDLAYPLGLAWVILLVRKLVERFVFRPLGQKLGVKEQRKRALAPRELLKERQTGAAGGDHAEERSLERWLRQKKLLGRPSKLDKFSETGWRWLYYTNIFGFGLVSKWIPFMHIGTVVWDWSPLTRLKGSNI